MNKHFVPSVSPEQALNWFERHQARILSEWSELVRFASVSADPERASACVACAEWLCACLDRLDLPARLLQTDGHPVVYAASAGHPGPGASTTLFYGHYDVQPESPLDAWESPPFDPVLRNGRLYGRGAQDNKGQLFFVLQALACLREAGAAIPPLRVLLDGEEECGSPSLTARLDDWRDRLGAAVLLVCDTFAGPAGRPAITAGLRGLIHFEVIVQGANRDLHSGIHGGVAPNPALGLIRMLDSLHEPDGRIRVPGFLDGLQPPSPEEQALLDASVSEDESYKRELGVPPLGGERRLPLLERRGFRPTIEVNGMFGGYTGKGNKTIIPASATAKLSCRLCPGQDPADCLVQLKQHLRDACPPGMRVTFADECVAGAGFRLPLDAPVFVKARAALSAVDARGPMYLWEGASIPVIGRLSEVSGAAPLLVGFGAEDDRVHAPNESFSIAQFRQGFVFATMLLQSLS